MHGPMNIKHKILLRVVGFRARFEQGVSLTKAEVIVLEPVFRCLGCKMLVL